MYLLLICSKTRLQLLQLSDSCTKYNLSLLYTVKVWSTSKYKYLSASNLWCTYSKFSVNVLSFTDSVLLTCFWCRWRCASCVIWQTDAQQVVKLQSTRTWLLVHGQKNSEQRGRRLLLLLCYPPLNVCLWHKPKKLRHRGGRIKDMTAERQSAEQMFQFLHFIGNNESLHVSLEAQREFTAF